MKFNLPRLIRSRELTNTCQDNVSLLASHLQADAFCARAMDGKAAAAAPPTSEMNSRRLIDALDTSHTGRLLIYRQGSS